MEHDEYVTRAQQGAALVEGGDPASALELFAGLAADPTLPDIDRATMWHNVAVAAALAGRPDGEVEGAWRAGVELERPWMRDTVRRGLGRWLAERGRGAEAAATFRELLGEGYHTSRERRQLAEALAVLDGRHP